MSYITPCETLTFFEAKRIHRFWFYGGSDRVTNRLHAAALAVIDAHRPPTILPAPIDWYTDDGSDRAFEAAAEARAEALERDEMRAQHFNDGL